MEQATKTVKTVGNAAFGLSDTVEYEAKCSVEISNTVKDGPRIAVVKAYGNTVESASFQAVKGYIEATLMLKDALSPTKADV